MDGLPWDWNSYGEYLDSVQALQPALNIVGLAGHSAIRYEAMGDRSMDEGAQASDKELAHIAKMVQQSVEEGAVGFSTSRFLLHTVPDGRCTRAPGQTCVRPRPFKRPSLQAVELVRFSNPPTTCKPVTKQNCKCSATAPS